MAASSAWLAGVLAKLSGSSAVIALLWAFIALALAAFIWRAFGSPDRTTLARRIAGVCAFLFAIAGATIAAIGALGSRSSESVEAASASEAFRTEGDWIPWTPETEARLRAEGRIVFVDFTADWCLSCAANEALALNDSRVRRRFAELDAAILKADWTGRDERIAAELASFGRAGVPLYVLYVPGAAPRLLPEILTPATVLTALETADRL